MGTGRSGSRFLDRLRYLLRADGAGGNKADWLHAGTSQCGGDSLSLACGRRNHVPCGAIGGHKLCGWAGGDAGGKFL